MKVIGIIFLGLLFLGALLYYLIQQSKKPSGIVGVLMMRLFNKAYLPMVRWALSFYNPSESPMKILDIGVGNGKSTTLLVKNFPKSSVIGIEISEIAIKEARKLPTTAVFQLENIENTSFDSKTFDLICAFQTHFHWQDLKKAFSEIRRVLTDEGILLVACKYAKIRYYLPQYKDTQAYQKFLNTIVLQLVQEENILQNSFLRFPYHKGEHFYNISIKTMVQTSTLQCRVRHLYASNNIFTIEISQNNHNSLDNQMIFLGEEINTYIFPLTISVNKEGEVIEVGDFQSILQRWNSKKEKINQFFQGKIIQNIINKTEDILLSSKTISHNLNTNILWAFLLRGVTGKYENGECRKKLSVNLGGRKFEVVNKMSFSENLQATTYKVLQDIFEINDSAKIISSEYNLYKENNIIENAKIDIFRPENKFTIYITKLV